MSTRRKQTLGVSALVVLAILFFALTMISSVALRGMQVDLTENDLYTISQGTKHVLAQIDEPINLYFYFSNEAAADEPNLRSYAQRVQELLEEFVLHSNGKLSLQVIDPVAFSEAEDDAARFGLQGVPVGQTSETIYFDGQAGGHPVLRAGQGGVPRVRRRASRLLARPSQASRRRTALELGRQRRLRLQHAADPRRLGHRR
jgi:ABC-type uncharacterized transport system involved in gliding motility auxiliary subunit